VGAGQDSGRVCPGGSNGKPRYKAAFRDARGVVTSRTFPRIGQAQDFLADMRIRRATNTLPDVSKGARTMTDLWEHFEKTYRGKPSTFASYAHRWRNHIQPAFGKSRLDSLRRSGIEEFYEALEARTRYSPEGAADTPQDACRGNPGGVAVRNPADGIPMPEAAPEREPRVLTEDEITRLVDAVPPRYRALVLTLADTGARPGELIALRVKNLDGSIRIVETTTEVHGKGQVTGTPKTRNSMRTVPMTPRLRAAVRDHFDAGYANRFDPESYVFPTEVVPRSGSRTYGVG
jgi:integrase